MRLKKQDNALRPEISLNATSDLIQIKAHTFVHAHTWPTQVGDRHGPCHPCRPNRRSADRRALRSDYRHHLWSRRPALAVLPAGRNRRICPRNDARQGRSLAADLFNRRGLGSGSTDVWPDRRHRSTNDGRSRKLVWGDHWWVDVRRRHGSRTGVLRSALGACRNGQPALCGLGPDLCRGRANEPHRLACPDPRSIGRHVDHRWWTKHGPADNTASARRLGVGFWPRNRPSRA